MIINEGQRNAFYAMIELCGEIDENDLTVADLEAACREMLEGGHDKIKTCLYMMQVAVVLAQPITEDEPTDTGAGE